MQLKSPAHLGRTLASFPGSSPCARRRKIPGQRAWYAFARDTWHVDVTAIIHLSVTSQLERADFCGSDRAT